MRKLIASNFTNMRPQSTNIGPTLKVEGFEHICVNITAFPANATEYVHIVNTQKKDTKISLTGDEFKVVFESMGPTICEFIAKAKAVIEENGWHKQAELEKERAQSNCVVLENKKTKLSRAPTIDLKEDDDGDHEEDQPMEESVFRKKVFHQKKRKQTRALLLSDTESEEEPVKRKRKPKKKVAPMVEGEGKEETGTKTVEVPPATVPVVTV
jgi:hypothetical protein